MNLTTVERVKDQLGKNLDTDDTPIHNLVEEVSAEMSTLLDRTIQTPATAITEVQDVKKGQRKFFLRAYPISSVTSVKNAWDRDFANTTAIADTNYYVDNEAGSIFIDKVTLTPAPGGLQVVYLGGMGADTTTFMANFPDISSACTTEVVFRYLRRFRPGVVTEAISGATTTIGQRSQFLTNIEKALEPHIRSHTVI